MWDWFLKFRPGITWTEIESWARITGNRPEGWEGELLLRLDAMRL